jgi:hypothetical protein
MRCARMRDDGGLTKAGDSCGFYVDFCGLFGSLWREILVRAGRIRGSGDL